MTARPRIAAPAPRIFPVLPLRRFPSSMRSEPRSGLGEVEVVDTNLRAPPHGEVQLYINVRESRKLRGGGEFVARDLRKVRERCEAKRVAGMREKKKSEREANAGREGVVSAPWMRSLPGVLLFGSSARAKRRRSDAR